MRHVRHHVLVGADPRGQHLRNRRVRDRREPPVDRARRVRVPLLRHVSQGHHEREDPVLVVDQDLPEVPRLDPAERHRGPRREAHREHRGRDIRAERDQPRGPADLHVRLHQLIREPHALVLCAHEHVQILLLKLLRDPRGDLRTRRRARDGREPRRGPIHKLDAPLPQDHVVRRAQPDPAIHRILTGHVETRVLQVSDRLDDLLREEGRHPRVQRGGQIRKMHILLDERREQRPTSLQDGLHIAQRLHRNPQDSVDDGQIVRGVRKTHFLLRAPPVHRFLPLLFGPVDDLVCPPDRRGTDDFRHVRYLL